MSIDLTTTHPDPVVTPGWRARRRLRRAERRRLAGQDLLAVRLAELYQIRALLQETTTLVNIGWIQNAWFAVLDEQGRTHKLTSYDVHLADHRPVSGVCLVGGIVYAAGGPRTVRSQLVQRTLDITWHALYEGDREQVNWCPSPAVRTAHLRDLTRWNDDPRRTAGQVSELLRSAVGVTERQIELRRVQQSAVASG